MEEREDTGIWRRGKTQEYGGENGKKRQERKRTTKGEGHTELQRKRKWREDEGTW